MEGERRVDKLIVNFRFSLLNSQLTPEVKGEKMGGVIIGAGGGATTGEGYGIDRCLGAV